MSHVRAFVHHWAPALIGGAAVALVLVVVAGIGLLQSRHNQAAHDAVVERNTARVSACVSAKMAARDFDDPLGRCLRATMGR